MSFTPVGEPSEARNPSGMISAIVFRSLAGYLHRYGP